MRELWCVDAQVRERSTFHSEEIDVTRYKAKDPPCKGWAGEAVGMVAINDAFLIEAAIYKILKVLLKTPCVEELLNSRRACILTSGASLVNGLRLR